MMSNPCTSTEYAMNLSQEEADHLAQVGDNLQSSCGKRHHKDLSMRLANDKEMKQLEKAGKSSQKSRLATDKVLKDYQ